MGSVGATVEAEKPATVTRLAEMGTKNGPGGMGCAGAKIKIGEWKCSTLER